MKCPNCGAQIDDDSVFCTECGKEIEKEKLTPKEEEKIESRLLQDRFSGLSITSLIAGILTLIFSLFLAAIRHSFLNPYLGIIINPYLGIIICFLPAIGAIVCGAVESQE
jgi:uncharacterized membrane protein YvbJ